MYSSSATRPGTPCVPGGAGYTVLERAGLIQRRRLGRLRRCRLVAHPMRHAAAWLGRYRRFWEQQFDRLDAYLDETLDGPASVETLERAR